MKDVGFNKEEEISITCFGRSGQVLKDLLGECRDEYLSQIKNKTTIFENRGDFWKKVVTKEIRPLSTVIFSEKKKQHLIDDVKSFLDPETRLWYAKRTIPYRKGYLLYGPPGTGKSSFSLSVAGELDLDIYIISIPGVNDLILKDLFIKLPEKCVVLLEDIDAVGAARLSNPDESMDEPQSLKKSVSLSGLLNTLDGVASQEGRILIMTTNHIEKLDEALIRPGRVDEKAEFELADTNMSAQLFAFIFKPDIAIDTKRESEADVVVDRLATEFASKVPELEFSPAQIMSFLLQHRQSPTAALEYTEKWVTALLYEKRAKLTNGVARTYSDREFWRSSEVPSVAPAIRSSTSDDSELYDTASCEDFLQVPPCSPAYRSAGEDDTSLYDTACSPFNESQRCSVEKPIWRRTFEEARRDALQSSGATLAPVLVSALAQGSMKAKPHQFDEGAGGRMARYTSSSFGSCQVPVHVMTLSATAVPGFQTGAQPNAPPLSLSKHELLNRGSGIDDQEEFKNGRTELSNTGDDDAANDDILDGMLDLFTRAAFFHDGSEFLLDPSPEQVELLIYQAEPKDGAPRRGNLSRDTLDSRLNDLEDRIAWTREISIARLRYDETYWRINNAIEQLYDHEHVRIIGLDPRLPMSEQTILGAAAVTVGCLSCRFKYRVPKNLNPSSLFELLIVFSYLAEHACPGCCELEKSFDECSDEDI